MKGFANRNPPTRRQSEELTDEDAPPHDDCHTQMDASDIDFGVTDSSGPLNLFENDQLWGILRVIRTQTEYKLLHRQRDGLRDHYVIGRSKGCDVVIPDKRVSSHHCSVYCDYTQATLRVYVEDNSSNGTFVNGSSTKLGKKQRTELKSGDEIYLLNPDLPTPVPDEAGPFLFINMRERYAMQKKILQVSESESLKKRRTIGRHIEDEYIIGEQLGSGMCGQVHRCLHKSSRKQYAVKIINTRRFSLSPGLSTKELREEAEIMRNLDHPHIIRIQDAFEMGHTLYIVMELVTGGDLFDKIIELGKYSEDDARRVLIKVMDAVSYLHGMNIVHRDLKPENILLTANNDPNEVKITDFGLAKRTNQEGLKTFCGTPQYFAPEVLRRKAPADAAGMNSSYGHKADVWSIGVITYIMLSGSFPFDDEHLFDQIEHAQYSLGGAEWVTVSPLAKHFIRSLMNLNIEKRLDIHAAMRHPWIQEYQSCHPQILQRAGSASSRVGLGSPLPPPAVPPFEAASSEREPSATKPGIITPDKVSFEAEQSATSGTNDLAAEELLMLQKNSQENSATSQPEQAGKPTIFWSNKAALVKLASIRKKVSMRQVSPALVSASGDSDARTTPHQSETVSLNMRASTISCERNPLQHKDDMNFDAAIRSPEAASGGALVVSQSQSDIGKKKRKRKNSSAQLEGKVLSDDDIDCFSDEAAADARTSDGAAGQSPRIAAKRSHTMSRVDKKARTPNKSRNISAKKNAKNTAAEDKGNIKITDRAGVIGLPTAVTELPLQQLELGAHVPSQPLGLTRRHTAAGNALSGRRKSIGGNVTKIESKGIDSYFAKQRVLRVPVPSLSAAFVENNHDDDPAVLPST